MKRILSAIMFLACVLPVPGNDRPTAAPRRTPREALQAFQDLIGTWRCTGEPSGGTREENQRGFWQEQAAWVWRFKGEDVWLQATFERGKNFSAAQLRYHPGKDLYELTVRTPAGAALTYTGGVEKRRLTLDHQDGAGGKSQRLVLNLLHSNRYLLRQEERAPGQASFRPVYQVGATKEGVPFASGANHPECVVSGGLGTSLVNYKGKAYHVCCSGCRDAFNEEPEKYIREYEARRKAGKQ